MFRCKYPAELWPDSKNYPAGTETWPDMKKRPDSAGTGTGYPVHP